MPTTTEAMLRSIPHDADKSDFNQRDSAKVHFDMHSVSNRSKRRRKSSRRSEKNHSLEYEEEMLKKEMHLPYWERKSYRSYKQIKVLQPKIDTPIDEYIRVKIE